MEVRSLSPQLLLLSVPGARVALNDKDEVRLLKEQFVQAGVTQLVEFQISNLTVEGSSPFARSCANECEVVSAPERRLW